MIESARYIHISSFTFNFLFAQSELLSKYLRWNSLLFFIEILIEWQHKEFGLLLLCLLPINSSNENERFWIHYAIDLWPNLDIGCLFYYCWAICEEKLDYLVKNLICRIIHESVTAFIRNNFTVRYQQKICLVNQTNNFGMWMSKRFRLAYEILWMNS